MPVLTRVCLTKSQADVPAPSGSGFATVGDLMAAAANEAAGSGADPSGADFGVVYGNGDGTFSIGVVGVGGFSIISIVGVGVF